MKNVSFDNIVKFQDIEEFYLPKNCVICGDETENRIEKSEYGSYTTSKDYKKNYKFELPICDECNSKVNLKAGKSGAIIFLSVIFGIILGIMVYNLTYTILLSVAVFAVLFIFSFLNYKAKIRPRIKLSDFLQIKAIPNEELIQFTFVNKDYADYVNKINSEKLEAKRIKAERIQAEKLEAERIKAERIKAERIQAEKLEAERIKAERIQAEKIEAERIKAERIKAEKIEAEKIKEKEKSEAILADGKNLEPIPVTETNKNLEAIPTTESLVDNIQTNSAKIPFKDISKITELTEIPAIEEIPPVTKKCPKCGSTLKPNWKFCVFCSEVIKD